MISYKATTEAIDELPGDIFSIEDKSMLKKKAVVMNDAQIWLANKLKVSLEDVDLLFTKYLQLKLTHAAIRNDFVELTGDEIRLVSIESIGDFCKECHYPKAQDVIDAMSFIHQKIQQAQQQKEEQWTLERQTAESLEDYQILLEDDSLLTGSAEN